MQILVLPTKLKRPSMTPHHIHRQQILHQLSRASSADLVLVSAPAGSGKSTAVSSWLRDSDQSAIWYSLDQWDNDVHVFLSYVVHGIHMIDQEVGRKLQELLEAYQTLGQQPFMRSMIVLLLQLNEPIVLVLDDYHLIDNREIDQMLHQFLSHASERLKVVIITREDPSLPVAALRMKGKLLEVRAKDLMFSDQETSELLHTYLDQPLQAEDITRLRRRTEGWAAGIQLAALSMRRVENVSDFIRAFSGTHYYIVDYLLEEVMNQLPFATQTFLLQTAIFDDFSAKLCDDVLELEPGFSQSILMELVQNNMFLISLDDRREWFRYHHLFRDTLLKRLNEQAQERVVSQPETLHRKAGDWFARSGMERQAIAHYLNAEEYTPAAALIENLWSHMDVQLQAALWLSMAKQLPEQVIERRPVLAMGYGWALLDTGELPEAQRWLSIAERLYERYMDDGDAEGLLVSDLEQLDLMPATLASAHGYIAAGMGEIDQLFHYANRSLEMTPEDQHYKRGVIGMLLGFAHWSMGELDRAETAIRQALQDIEKDVNRLTVNSFFMVLAELFTQQGRLEEARIILEQTITRVKERENVPILLASLYYGLAKVAFLRGNNSQARAYLQESEGYGDQYALMDWRYKRSLLWARVLGSEGAFEQALAYIDEGRQHYFMNPIPDFETLEGVEAFLLSKEGRRTGLQIQWPEEKVAYLQIFDMGTYMYRAVFAQHDEPLQNVGKYLSICDQICAEAVEQNCLSNQVRALVLKGLCMMKGGLKLEGHMVLKEAAALALDEKYVRPFLDYLPEDVWAAYVQLEDGMTQRDRANEQLDEPLTARELEVMALIGAGKTNQEIADQLYLALSTVKGYVQNIYGKLSVRRRTEAIAKSREIGLL